MTPEKYKHPQKVVKKMQKSTRTKYKKAFKVHLLYLNMVSNENLAI